MKKASIRTSVASGGTPVEYRATVSGLLSIGREEKPPLTPEYQAIYEANLVDMEKGGQGIDPTYSCLSPGMPRVMIPYIGMEFVVTPPVTYILFE